MSAGRFQPVANVPLPDCVRAQLAALGERVRRAELAAASARLALVVAGGLVGWLAIDYWVVTVAFATGLWDLGGRLVLSLAFSGLLLREARSGLCAVLKRRRSDDQLAMLLETAHPALDGRLISTVQLVREVNRGTGSRVASPALVQALAEDIEVRAATLDTACAWDTSLSRRLTALAITAFLVLAPLAAWKHDLTSCFLRRLAFLPAEYPTATRILSVDLPSLVGRGDPVVITITVDGASRIPAQAEAVVRGPDGSRSTIRLERLAAGAVAGGAGAAAGTAGTAPQAVRFRGTFPQAVDDLAIRPRAGDHRWSAWQTVRVLRRPAVKELALHLDFPAYLARPPLDSAVGDLDVPTGTRITVRARLSRPVERAILALKRGAAAPEEAAMSLGEEKGLAEGSFTVDADGAWSIGLVDGEGLDAGQPPLWTIVARPDRPPTIAVSFPPRDLDVTRMARWPLRFTTADDYGVARVRLRWRVVPPDGDPEAATGEALSAVVPGAATRGTALFTGEQVFDLAPLNLTTGSRVVWWLEAEDIRAPQPNLTASRRGIFTVIDPAEMRERLMNERAEIMEAVKQLRDREREARDGVEDVRKGLKP